MFGYHAPEVDIFAAKGHPAFARIQPAGPWEYRPHPAGGCMAVFAGGKRGPDDFGAPVDAGHGLRFLPPKAPLVPGDLAKMSAGRADVTHVPLASGHTVAVLPAYLEPRRVLSGGRMGDPATRYGMLAREVLGRIHDKDASISLLDPDVIDLIHLALSQTYRVTPDLLDWSGWITDQDLEPLLMAVMSGPKAEPAADPSPSASEAAGSQASP